MAIQIETKQKNKETDVMTQKDVADIYKYTNKEFTFL